VQRVESQPSRTVTGGWGSELARRLPRRLAGWALWTLDPRARSFLLAVETVYVVAVVAGFAHRLPSGQDVATFGVLAGCGVLSIEGSLRLVWRQARRQNDMMAVWTLPATLLLPPVLAALVVIPLDLYFIRRVSRTEPVKAVFNSACIGLSCFIGALVHQSLIGADGSGNTADLHALVGSSGALVALVVSALIRQAVNDVLVAEVIVLTGPKGSRFRDGFNKRDDWGIVIAESCTGVLVAIACAASPYTVLFAVPPVLVLQRTLLLAEFREAARTDAKTGLANSSYWREVAEREIGRARGSRESLAFLLVDIDHFKHVNDKFGHLVGDDVLLAVANGLTDGLRPRDFVGRFGGEEFVILLSGSDADQAQHTAERIREHIAGIAVPASTRHDDVGVTISIGVAAFPESGHSVHELLDAADTALYAAKHSGRNCVRRAEPARQQVLDLTDSARVLDLRRPGSPVVD
jgi:diguanylate cyclase (GGDEF)-like protein